MLNERIADLIQAELDGALAETDREELKIALAESAVARSYRDEMLHLASMLDEVPDLEPPAGLNRRILDSIELPAPRQLPAWLRNWFQPASYGLAVAAGMLLAVGMIRILPIPGDDMTSLVGSMVSHEASLPDASRSQLAVDLDAVEGSVLLKDLNGTLALQFDLVSAEEVEIVIPLAESGLQFGGFVHDDKDINVLEVSGGNVRVVNQGSNRFVVFLRQPEGFSPGSDQNLGVSISQDNVRIFKGTIAFGG
ncbi:MAG TPA: hypothetical protein VJN01_10505 [Xanthomonadales bacterium]|nr:hypothetical protein [Xanthomonadales bacterium]